MSAQYVTSTIVNICFISKINIYYSHKVSTSGPVIYTLFQYYVNTYEVLIQAILQELSIHGSGLM